MLLFLVALQQDPDTLRPAAILPDVQVTVTRHSTRLSRLPAAVTVVGGAEATRGRQGLGLDEILSGLPGIHVANRANYSLDQRFSLRGFGSRANFGLRGVKVLLDGIPQTLPDGQSQLTNLDYASLGRIEVHRGSAGAMYGNASGGVLSLQSRAAPSSGWVQSARTSVGAFGTRKLDAWSGLRSGHLGATLALSRFDTDGYREHSHARAVQANASADLLLGSAWLLESRLRIAHAPKAENPGALTLTESVTNPRMAATNNVLRGADKMVDQQQVSMTLRHFMASGTSGALTVFALWRDLDNPLATPPPGPPNPTFGTYNRIDRFAGGVRIDASVPLERSGDPILVTGVDMQVMRDDRVNEIAQGGLPTGVLLADQRERVSELGPFARLEWTRGPATITAGTRWDRVAFDVTDRYLPDGDGSGERVMSSLGGHLGASVEVSTGLIPWISVSTAFESPTTTELAVRSGGAIGFNDSLGPQRATTLEAGARGHSGRYGWELVAFTASVRNAIVQVREVSGRAAFANAGRTRQRGIEFGFTAEPANGIDLGASWTFADYTFREYRIRSGSTVDTLDGNRLPATPRHQLRLSTRIRRGPWSVAVDHQIASSMFADDDNLLRVDGVGAGVTGIRASWTTLVGSTVLRPFGGVDNLFDRSYVGSVTINGFGGRSFEPAPRRNLWVGLEIQFGKS